ncbi:hypothetical protein HDZ31DRAFT_82105 [Schizophyllum fasciatum]
MAAPKVLFPAPPPTSNVLTPRQRAQLLRTTKKLGRILGVAPRVLDAENVFADMTSVKPAPAGHIPTFSIGRTATHRQSTSSSSAAASVADAAAVPFLRLALTTGPVRQPSPRSRAFTLVPSGHSAVRKSESAVAGKENGAGGHRASGNALRRRKLDRLRHTLGEGVPQELIFPGAGDVGCDSHDVECGAGVGHTAAVVAAEHRDGAEDPPPRPTTALGVRSVTDDVLRAMSSTPDLLGMVWEDANEEEREAPAAWSSSAEMDPSTCELASACELDLACECNPASWSASVDLPPAWSSEYSILPVYPTPGIPAIWCAPAHPWGAPSTRLDAILESDDEE